MGLDVSPHAMIYKTGHVCGGSENDIQRCHSQSPHRYVWPSFLLIFWLKQQEVQTSLYVILRAPADISCSVEIQRYDGTLLSEPCYRIKR